MPGNRALRALSVAVWGAWKTGAGPPHRPLGLPAKRPRFCPPRSQGESVSSGFSVNSRLEPEKGDRACTDMSPAPGRRPSRRGPPYPGRRQAARSTLGPARGRGAPGEAGCCWAPREGGGAGGFGRGTRLKGANPVGRKCGRASAARPSAARAAGERTAHRRAPARALRQRWGSDAASTVPPPPPAPASSAPGARTRGGVHPGAPRAARARAGCLPPRAAAAPREACGLAPHAPKESGGTRGRY